ncbi:MAG: adenylate kinase [Acidobacteria bacterium]|nr:adenylate kinase [Acidobacteriota bacterium]
MSGKPLRALLLGAPGCGKGTQAEKLSDTLGIPAISTGEMLRQAVSEGTALGRKVEGVMAAGELVSDELMSEVVAERLARSDAAGGFLLDGYPRTLGQAETLDGLLSREGWHLDRVIVLDVPEAELVRRALGRQRADDTEEVIRERLRVYREKTEPLIEHYSARGILSHVDGNREIDYVTDAVRAALAGD